MNLTAKVGQRKRTSIVAVFAILLSATTVVAQSTTVQNQPLSHQTVAKQLTPQQEVPDQVVTKNDATDKQQSTATAVKEAEPSEGSEAPEKGFDPKSIPVGPMLVFDAASGEVLNESRSGETWYPASLTKLMTAYVVFQKIREGKLKLDQKIMVSRLAARQPASRVGAQSGTSVSVNLALQALLVYSANDMAFVLAEASSGTHFHFSREMNAAAAKLGMNGSHFVNPNGLYDPRHYTTARDFGILASALYREFPEHAHYFSQQYVQIGRRRLPNRNMLIRIMETADGMKTGFVCDSGYNLVASATQNGRKIIAVLMGTKSGYARAILAKNLLESGFATPNDPSHKKISDLKDEPFGVKPIFDMTPQVCRRKEVAELVDPTTLSGWGVSFGLQPTAAQADSALHNNLLKQAGRNAMGFPATYKAQDKDGFIPLIWGMGRGDAEGTCAAYRASGTSCSVVPEDIFKLYSDMYANQLQKAKPQKPAAQGSDGSSVKTKKQTGQKKSRKAKKTKR